MLSLNRKEKELLRRGLKKEKELGEEPFQGHLPLTR